jgi:hypothetical protein
MGNAEVVDRRDEFPGVPEGDAGREGEDVAGEDEEEDAEGREIGRLRLFVVGQWVTPSAWATARASCTAAAS